MKIIPNYFVGTLENGIPIYCNVVETITQGKFVPIYTSKRKVKNHKDIISNPYHYFHLDSLKQYIKKEFKIPKDFIITFAAPGYDGKFRFFEYEDYSKSSFSLKTTYCPFMTCNQIIIVYNEGFMTCPHCNKTFMPE